MSEGIAYDVRLEELLDQVKNEIWMNEEIQIQPKRQRDIILKKCSEVFGINFFSWMPFLLRKIWFLFE